MLKTPYLLHMFHKAVFELCLWHIINNRRCFSSVENNSRIDLLLLLFMGAIEIVISIFFSSFSQLLTMRLENCDQPNIHFEVDSEKITQKTWMSNAVIVNWTTFRLIFGIMLACDIYPLNVLFRMWLNC